MLPQGRQWLRIVVRFYEFAFVLQTELFSLSKTTPNFTCRLNCDVTALKLELQLPHFPKNDPTVRAQDAAMLAGSCGVTGGSCQNKRHVPLKCTTNSFSLSLLSLSYFIYLFILYLFAYMRGYICSSTVISDDYLNCEIKRNDEKMQIPTYIKKNMNINLRANKNPVIFIS